jgi:hypothetical protein
VLRKIRYKCRAIWQMVRGYLQGKRYLSRKQSESSSMEGNPSSLSELDVNGNLTKQVSKEHEFPK